MTTYLDTIAARKLKPRSLDDYWSKTRNDIIPHLGRHLDAAYGALLDAGHAPSHVLKVHRILSRALKIAHRRELVGRNVATLIDPPTVEQQETETFSQEECRTFLRAAAELPTGMRWAVGVGLGIRQGEALGLRWSYVNLDAGYLRTWWQLQRLTWRHGCADPRAGRRPAPPFRAVPAGLPGPPGVQARMPETVSVRLHPARRCMPRAQERRARVHQSQDEEESPVLADPSADDSAAA